MTAHSLLLWARAFIVESSEEKDETRDEFIKWVDSQSSPTIEFIGEFVVKRDDIIISTGVHKYESVDAFRVELPMGTVETSVDVEDTLVREWTRTTNSKDHTYTERFTLRKEIS